MKKRNFLMMAALLFGMTLAACGPTPAEPSSEEQPGQSTVEPGSTEEQPSTSEAPQPSSSEAPQPSSSEAPQPSSSEEPPAPTKAATVTSVDVAAKSNKAYLQISGTAEGFTSADFLWALALQHAGAESAGDASTEFVLGTTATFTDADYTLPATLNNDGTFLKPYLVSILIFRM